MRGEPKVSHLLFKLAFNLSDEARGVLTLFDCSATLTAMGSDRSSLPVPPTEPVANPSVEELRDYIARLHSYINELVQVAQRASALRHALADLYQKQSGWRRRRERMEHEILGVLDVISAEGAAVPYPMRISSHVRRGWMDAVRASGEPQRRAVERALLVAMASCPKIKAGGWEWPEFLRSVDFSVRRPFAMEFLGGIDEAEIQKALEACAMPTAEGDDRRRATGEPDA
jgi:hypothetical protein